MFVTKDMLVDLEKGYGSPGHWSFSVEIDRKEFDRIRRSQRDGRRHDFTLYIVKSRQIVVIAKHFYPPGLFRAPSGGLKPGESPVDGMNREAFEETGCRIKLRNYLLRTEACFTCKDEVIVWHSHVLQADYISGDFEFTDTHEIRECRLAELSEFANFAQIMRGLNVGGLHYRAALHDQVAPLLEL